MQSEVCDYLMYFSAKQSFCYLVLLKGHLRHVNPIWLARRNDFDAIYNTCVALLLAGQLQRDAQFEEEGEQ